MHHGNGTEDIFRRDPSVFFSSTFQHPFYPGSGADTRSDLIGNVPLPAGTGGPRFRVAFEERILPALNDFEPELLFISAGFDAHDDDPLAQLCLLEEDFAWVTGKLNLQDEGCRMLRAKPGAMPSSQGSFLIKAVRRCLDRQYWAVGTKPDLSVLGGLDLDHGQHLVPPVANGFGIDDATAGLARFAGV